MYLMEKQWAFEEAISDNDQCQYNRTRGVMIKSKI